MDAKASWQDLDPVRKHMTLQELLPQLGSVVSSPQGEVYPYEVRRWIYSRGG